MSFIVCFINEYRKVYIDYYTLEYCKVYPKNIPQEEIKNE